MYLLPLQSTLVESAGSTMLAENNTHMSDTYSFISVSRVMFIIIIIDIPLKWMRISYIKSLHFVIGAPSHCNIVQLLHACIELPRNPDGRKVEKKVEVSAFI